MDLEELKEVLTRGGVDFSGWGTAGQSKPITKLLEEINGGESDLREEEGRLKRFVSSIYVAITYQRLTLKEDRAEWKTGDRPPRRRDVPGSVAGKMMRGERPHQAAVREVSEEIQIKVDENRLALNKREVRETDQSYSFPGLATVFDESFLSLELHPDEFRAEGYSEEADDKITYFVWR